MVAATGALDRKSHVSPCDAWPSRDTITHVTHKPEIALRLGLPLAASRSDRVLRSLEAPEEPKLQGDPMDHQEQHHEHHRKSREEHKKEQKEYEAHEETTVRTIHPAWFVAIGILLIAGVVI